MPSGESFRIRSRPHSVISRLPSWSKTRPAGWRNRACAAGPSRNSPKFAMFSEKTGPPPATVVTLQSGEILRMRLLLKSTTKMKPSASTATPAGWANCASAHGPSSTPSPFPPAIVVTLPSGAIRRIAWFPESATMTLPTASRAMPHGRSNRASPAGPSMNLSSTGTRVGWPAKTSTVTPRTLGTSGAPATPRPGGPGPPPRVIRRIAWFPSSATTSVPSLKRAIAPGRLKVARSSAPFTKPGTPAPATARRAPSLVSRSI